MVDELLALAKLPAVCGYINQVVNHANAKNHSEILASALDGIKTFNSTNCSNALFPETLFQVDSHLSSLELLCHTEATRQTGAVRDGLEKVALQTIRVQTETANFMFDASTVLSEVMDVLDSFQSFLALAYTGDTNSKALIMTKALKAKKDLADFDDSRLESLARNAQSLREEFQHLAHYCKFSLHQEIKGAIKVLETSKETKAVSEQGRIQEKLNNATRVRANHLQTVSEETSKWTDLKAKIDLYNQASAPKRWFLSKPNHEEVKRLEHLLTQLNLAVLEASQEVATLTRKYQDAAPKAGLTEEAFILQTLLNDLHTYGGLLKVTTDALRDVKTNLLSFRLFLRSAVQEHVPFGHPEVKTRFAELISTFFLFQNSLQLPVQRFTSTTLKENTSQQ